MSNSTENKINLCEKYNILNELKSKNFESIPTFEEYEWSEEFEEIGKIEYYFSNGKFHIPTLKVSYLNESLRKKTNNGCLYMMTYKNPDTNKEHILKIGQTSTSLDKRIQSYNCGEIKYQNGKGTASTTNTFVKQNILNFNGEITLRAYTFDDNTISQITDINLPRFTMFSSNLISKMYKEVEGKYIEKYISQFGEKPVLCGQK